MVIEPRGLAASSIFLLSRAGKRDDQTIFTAFLVPESHCDVIAGHPSKAKVEQDELGPVNTCDFEGFGIAAISPEPHRPQLPLRYSCNRPGDAGSNAIIAIKSKSRFEVDSSRLSTEGVPGFGRVPARGLHSQL
jgi:hypothetical protein